MNELLYVSLSVLNDAYALSMFGTRDWKKQVLILTTIQIKR